MKPAQLVAAATASAIAIALAATGAAASTAGQARGIDLSTPASIAAYLASKGVDPATVVWQTGLQNYAGPDCPGVGWNCTTASNVVQIAQAGGQNKFECDPAFFEGDGDPPFPLPDDVFTNPELNVCVIVQINETGEGQNHARCYERSNATPVAMLTCLVYQENASGDNFLQIHQRVQQSAGAEQNATVDVDVTQQNDAGNNHAQLVQQVFQSTSEVADLEPTDSGDEQEQRATFDIAPLTQNTQTGNNYAHLTQHLSQNGRAEGGPTTSQSQFSNQFGNVDQFAVVGEGDFVTLQAGGQGFSQAFAFQTEQQQLHGPGVQTQVGPQGCCGAGTQVGDPQQTAMNILQESSQDADGPLVEQDQDIAGSCNSSGVCDLTHHARNIADSTSESNRGTGPTFLTTTCSASREGTEEGGSCSSSTVEPSD